MFMHAHHWLICSCAVGLLLACDTDGTGGSDTDTGATSGSETSGDTSGSDTSGDATDATDSDASDSDTTDGSDSDGETDETTGPVGACSDVPCADQMILDLSLQTTVSAGAIGNNSEGDDWLTTVDATAGGTMGASMNPWVYLRLTADGAQRVDIDDESALTSTEWHIAAKRYGLRINSGSSGPGCVMSTALAAGSYAEVDSAPDSAQWQEEAFYDNTCTLIEDGSGLPGSPNYALGAWWGYNGCVTTTGIPFVLDLGDEGMIKLVVEAYYQSGQEDCNQNGAMGMGSGNLTWRWRFL